MDREPVIINQVSGKDYAMAAVQGVLGLLFVVIWVMGAVLAKGFWSTFLAIFFFPWGWYLCVELLMQRLGLISLCG
jgi:hypothetical protein